jgi:hypothetical protein
MGRVILGEAERRSDIKREDYLMWDERLVVRSGIRSDE